MFRYEIRPAVPEEWAVAAGLRWDSVREKGEESPYSRDVFAAGVAVWAAENQATHECFVATRDGTVVGTAWLAVLPRVPSPHAFERASGDLQNVYVVPELRNRGIGGRLVAAVLVRASERGLERVTVHSSPRAVVVYERSGFVSEDTMMHWVTTKPAGEKAAVEGMTGIEPA